MWFYRCCGIACIAVGLFMTATQFCVTMLKEIAIRSLPLVEGTEGYRSWSSPVSLTFACYIFNVTNPDEVMQGENPNLQECGPYVYDEILEKQVIDTDEEMDEIIYTTKSTYRINKALSQNNSKHEKVTILNSAYIGIMELLSTLPPDFMKKYGNNIPKLFPNRSSIFQKARPTDILFDGVKIMCNLKKFPELGKVCTTMQANPPPVLKATEREGVYLFSIFQRINDTFRGPFSVNRGQKDIRRLGDITSYKGKRVQSVWRTDECNTVKGTDTVTWAPLVEPLPFVSTFIPDLCRSVQADYDDDVSINGLTGMRFNMSERTWFPNATECYCVLMNKKPQCLPQGLIDVSECAKVPAIVSEPHFLHGDPKLLTYARGLNPDPSIHSTYIVIEPITGSPLSGQKKSQTNLRLRRLPVDLLTNVSEGYFPLMWCENGNTPSLFVISYTYQLLRLVNLFSFMEKIPLIVGIYVVFSSMLYCDYPKRRVQPTVTLVESLLISSNPREVARAT